MVISIPMQLVKPMRYYNLNSHSMIDVGFNHENVRSSISINTRNSFMESKMLQNSSSDRDLINPKASLRNQSLSPLKNTHKRSANDMFSSKKPFLKSQFVKT